MWVLTSDLLLEESQRKEKVSFCDMTQNQLLRRNAESFVSGEEESHTVVLESFCDRFLFLYIIYNIKYSQICPPYMSCFKTYNLQCY